MKRKRLIEAAEGAFGTVIRQGASFFRSRDKAKIRAAAGYGATFALSLLLSMVRGPMGIYPFSYGVVCASSGGLGTIMSFLGVVSGAFTMSTGMGAQIGVLNVIAFVRLAVCFLKGDFENKKGIMRRLFRERGYIRVVCAAGGASIMGCISVFKSQSIYYGLFSAILGIGSAVLVTASLLFFADRGAEPSKRTAGLAVLSLGLCAACEYFALPFSLGAVLTFMLSVYFSLSGHSYLGVVAGFSGGIALGGGYAAAFGSVGIVIAVLWEHSKTLAIVASALVASVLSVFSYGLDAVTDIIPELAFSAAVCASFVNIQGFSVRVPSFLVLEGGEPKAVERPREGTRYQRLGSAMEGLSNMLIEMGDKLRLPTKEEAKRIGATARAKYCSGCVHEKECSGRDCELVDSMFSNMEYRLTTNGRVSARIVPETVARRCYNMDSILESMNSASKKSAALSGASLKVRAYAADYNAIAGLLRDLSGEDAFTRDEAGEAALANELLCEGFGFDSSSVYGTRYRRVYMRGIDMSMAGVGELDIRLCAERVLNARLSPPDFSVDGGYISASMHSMPMLRLEAGHYAIKSNRDNASGDSVRSFENEEGYFYSMVFDGMGSGREAALTSGISCAFLEKLLAAGCPMKSALELLNCFVRGAQGECFTTVDLMEADLYTGRARFIKSGAAPSFVIRRGQLYKLHSKTVPVGIMRALDAESLSFDLLPGDRVVMVSDGVTGSYEESPWLYDILSEEAEANISVQAAARRIAECAAKNTGRDDDITVCVLKVESA